MLTKLIGKAFVATIEQWLAFFTAALHGKEKDKELPISSIQPRNIHHSHEIILYEQFAS